MEYTFSELSKIKLPGVLYCLKWHIKPTKQDVMALENALRRYTNRYKGISWFMAVSDTDSVKVHISATSGQ